MPYKIYTEYDRKRSENQARIMPELIKSVRRGVDVGRVRKQGGCLCLKC